MTKPEPPDRLAAIADLVAQCADMRDRAEAHGLDMLAYLLDVAHEEAEARLREFRRPVGGH